VLLGYMMSGSGRSDHMKLTDRVCTEHRRQNRWLRHLLLHCCSREYEWDTWLVKPIVHWCYFFQ